MSYSRASVCLAAERLDNNFWSAVEASRFAETEDEKPDQFSETKVARSYEQGRGSFANMYYARSCFSKFENLAGFPAILRIWPIIWTEQFLRNLIIYYVFRNGMSASLIW